MADLAAVEGGRQEAGDDRLAVEEDRARAALPPAAGPLPVAEGLRAKEREGGAAGATSADTASRSG
jgi:hypothetical protein